MAEQDDNADATATETPWEYSGPETLSLTLKKPIKLHEKDPNTIEMIELCEPETWQMSLFTQVSNKTHDDFEAGANLIAKNANITLQAARKLGNRDFKKALEFLMGFTTPPPKPTPELPLS